MRKELFKKIEFMGKKQFYLALLQECSKDGNVSFFMTVRYWASLEKERFVFGVFLCVPLGTWPPILLGVGVRKASRSRQCLRFFQI